MANTTPPGASDALPSAPSAAVAKVERARGRFTVTLPADLAADAVSLFLPGRVSVWSVEEAAAVGLTIPPATWAIALHDFLIYGRHLERLLPADLVGEVFPTRDGGVLQVHVLAVNTLPVKPRMVDRLKRCLDQARPKQPNGLPYPWAPVRTAPEEAPSGWNHDDDVVVGPATERAQRDAEPAEAYLRQAFERIARHLALAPFPLVVRAGAVNKNGFVTGRIHITEGGRPHRMVLTACPNADRAETLATMLHEFAHVVHDQRGHGRGFVTDLLGLAEAIFGRYFEAAISNADYATVDGWVACGVRAALAGHPAPAAVSPDEAKVAVTLRRVQKLRALAADQPGTPEAVAATARANTLLITHGLAGYQSPLAPGDSDEQMADVWYPVANGWKTRVAFTVAEFCGAFALHSAAYKGMHVFGEYADVVAAEYLTAVCTEALERRVQDHIARWRDEQDTIPRGAQVAERSSFLHSAVDGLERQLKATVDDRHAATLERAEAFASEEHTKRGKGWGTGRATRHHHNQAGFEAGKSMSVPSGGVGSQRGPKGYLT